MYGVISLDLDHGEQEGGRKFVDSLLDTEPNLLGQDFRQALFEHTVGHPLFTVELLQAMKDRGDLVLDDEGRWVQRAELEWKELPARVEAVIEERILRLEEQLREILSVASVEGEDFTAQVIARVQEIQERRLLRNLSQELERRHRLVRELSDGDGSDRLLSRYRFAHQLFQKYLYNNLSTGERRLLHGEIAQVLEDLYQDNLEEIVVQLAFHFHQGGQREKARTYLTQAGHQARRKYANQEAIQYYSQALSLTPEDGEERFQLLSARAEVFDIISQREEQKSEVEAMIDLAEKLDEDVLRYEALIAQTDFYLRTDHLKAQEPANRALAIAENMEDRVREGKAYYRLGYEQWMRGNSILGRKTLEQAIPRLQESEQKKDILDSLDMQSDLLYEADEFEAAVDVTKKLLDLSQEAGDRRMKANALAELAMIHCELKQMTEALQHARDALDIRQEIGDRRGECGSLNVLGHILTRMRIVDEGKQFHLRALSIAEAMEDSVGILSAVRQLYMGHYGPHLISQESLDFIEDQLEKSIARGHQTAIANLRWLKGQTLEGFGLFNLAIDTLQEGVQAMEQIGADELALFYLIFIGRYWAGACGYSEAQVIFTKVAESHESVDQTTYIWFDINQAYMDLHQGNVTTYREHLPKVHKAIDDSRIPYRWALGEAIDLAARLHLALDEPDEALEHSNELIHLLETRHRNYAPQQYLFTHTTVLRALGKEEEADEFLGRAYRWVMRIANNLLDEELKKSYLENVKVNRQIVAEAAARGIGSDLGGEE
jgi:tetratricopeptide (TPR) repeat protein